MASIIRIKRSSTAGNPTTLAAGELAYSALTDNGSNGGDRLYIGIGSETAGDAANHYVIGGKFFTDRLDHTAGTLTASSAIVVDSNSKIDNLLVDNIQINGNTISSTDTNGNLILTPNGTGKTVVTNLYIGDTSTSILEYIQDATGGQVTAGEGIDVTYDDAAGTVTIAGEDATDTNKGIASFSSTYFSVSSGAVSIANNAITLGTHTTGNYVATIADAGNSNITVANSGSESAAVTLDLTNTGVTAGSYGSASAVPAITVDAKGRITAISTNNISTSFTIAGDSGTDSFSNGGTLTFTGTDPVNTSVASDTVTISVSDASTSSKGIASFSSDNFSVTSGAVTIKDGGVSNAELVNSTITLGSSTLTLGSTTTAVAGLTQVDVDNIRIDGNEISSTDTNGNISLNPNGTGSVDVNSAKITNLAEPTSSSDAATKGYVDARAAGLDPKASVRVATTANITLSNTQTIDGVAVSVGDRVLVKDQSTASQNGVYVVASGSWSRASDFDEPSEVTAGVFFFVEEGTTNGDAGFVITSDNPLTVGTDALTFTQFSGAGQIVAGNGLAKSGNTLSVNVANGIEISADNVQLASSVAGDGLTYSSGVLAVVGTSNRISVSADAIDISASYVGQSSITTLGTIGSGTWQGTAIAPAYGGTGVANGSNNTITFTGNYTLGLTLTGNTSVTLPTSGTLVNTSVTSLSSLATVGTISSGTWQGTAIAAAYGGTGQTSYSTGDILVASGSTSLGKLSVGTSGKVLQSNGTTLVYGDIDGGTY